MCLPAVAEAAVVVEVEEVAAEVVRWEAEEVAIVEVPRR
jgi:hypothetical protein